MTYVFKLKQQTCLDVFCVPYKNNTNGQLVINLASMSYNYLCDWLVMMNLIEMNNKKKSYNQLQRTWHVPNDLSNVIESNSLM